MGFETSNVIVIEGLGGAGKTTAAQILAERYGFHNLNTGFLFRAAAAAIVHHGVPLPDIEPFIKEMSMDYVLDTPEDPSVSVNGLDVSSLLQTPAVTVMASYIGSLNSVSEKLEGMFDQSLVGGNFVAEGKNLSGRIDVPHTRFFLTATRQVRAYRKWMQAQGKGLTNYSLKNAVHDTTMNDFRDTRLVVVNSNTCVIETSTLTPGEVVDKMINYVDSGPGNSHLKTK